MQVIAAYLKTNLNFQQVIQVVNTAGDGYQFSPIETPLPLQPAQAFAELLPRVICTAATSVEEIFQTGIYKTGMEFTMKVDLDSGTYAQARVLFAGVLDALQQVSLVNQLNTTVDDNDNALVVIDGVVLGDMKLNDTGDRMFIKTIAMDVFGFSPGAP